MKTEKICVNCNKPFLAENKELARGFGLYCSLSCFHAYRKGKPSNKPKLRVSLECAWCHKKFERKPSYINHSRSGFHFCSRICKDTAQRIGGIKEIQPPHYGIVIGEYTYRSFAFYNLPHKCKICGYNKDERVLEVHHKDCNRENNVIENLEILCRNCHCEEHLKIDNR